MSMMNATFGLSAAINVKFCSGATPRYTPSGRVIFCKLGTTHWKDVSLDSRLSDRKYPFGSENSVESRQKVESA